MLLLDIRQLINNQLINDFEMPNSLYNYIYDQSINFMFPNMKCHLSKSATVIGLLYLHSVPSHDVVLLNVRKKINYWFSTRALSNNQMLCRGLDWDVRVRIWLVKFPFSNTSWTRSTLFGYFRRSDRIQKDRLNWNIFIKSLHNVLRSQHSGTRVMSRAPGIPGFSVLTECRYQNVFD